jgi:hypothetical protein
VKKKKSPPRPKPGERRSPATEFKSGDEWRGNAGGRPKKTPLTDALRRFLALDEKDFKAIAKSKKVTLTVAERMAIEILRLEADYRNLKEIADRTDGKVAQRIELTGDDGGPIEVADARDQLFDKLGS